MNVAVLNVNICLYANITFPYQSGQFGAHGVPALPPVLVGSSQEDVIVGAFLPVLLWTLNIVTDWKGKLTKQWIATQKNAQNQV